MDDRRFHSEAEDAAADPRLEALLRAAGEAETFERLVLGEPAEVAPPPVHRHGPRTRTFRLRRSDTHAPMTGAWMGLLGLAAAGAVAFLFVRVNPHPSFTSPTPLAQNSPRSLPPRHTPAIPEGWDDAPNPSEPAIANAKPHIEIYRPAAHPGSAGDASANMILAYYQDNDVGGGQACNPCQCLQWWNNDWGDGRAVQDVRPGELLSESLQHACMTSPDKVIVIGLSGPPEALPANDQQAREAMLCILTRQVEQACSNPDTSPAPGESFCLPASVAVRVQTWGR